MLRRHRDRKCQLQADTSARPSGSRPRTRPTAAASCRPPRIASTSSEQSTQAPPPQPPLPPLTLPVTETPPQDTERPPTQHGPAFWKPVIRESKEPLQVLGGGQWSPGKGVLGAEMQNSETEGSND